MKQLRRLFLIPTALKKVVLGSIPAIQYSRIHLTELLKSIDARWYPSQYSRLLTYGRNMIEELPI